MGIITRVGFCPKCYAAKRPQAGDIFVAQGASKNLHAFEAIGTNARRGFTPHLYQYERMMGVTVYYTVVCGMVGCGAYVIENTKKKCDEVFLDDQLFEDGYMPLKEWNALVMFKDTGFKI